MMPSNEVKINVTSREQFVAVISAAVLAGFKTAYTPEEYANRNYNSFPYPLLDFSRKSLNAGNNYWNEGETIELPEFFKRLSKVAKPLPKKEVRISGEYKAVANEDFTGVQVGCTFVKKETVEEILAMLNNKGETK